MSPGTLTANSRYNHVYVQVGVLVVGAFHRVQAATHAYWQCDHCAVTSRKQAVIKKHVEMMHGPAALRHASRNNEIDPPPYQYQPIYQAPVIGDVPDHRYAWLVSPHKDLTSDN